MHFFSLSNPSFTLQLLLHLNFQYDYVSLFYSKVFDTSLFKIWTLHVHKHLRSGLPFNYCQSMSQALLYYCMVNFYGVGTLTLNMLFHALISCFVLAPHKFLLSLIFLPKSHAVFTDANLPCQQQQPCVPLSET